MHGRRKRGLRGEGLNEGRRGDLCGWLGFMRGEELMVGGLEG